MLLFSANTSAFLWPQEWSWNTLQRDGETHTCVCLCERLWKGLRTEIESETWGGLLLCGESWGDINLGFWKIDRRHPWHRHQIPDFCQTVHSSTSWGTFTPTTTSILGIFTRTNYSPADRQLWMFEKPAETLILSGFSRDYHHKDSLKLKLKIQQLFFLKTCKSPKRAWNHTVCHPAADINSEIWGYSHSEMTYHSTAAAAVSLKLLAVPPLTGHFF